MFKIEMLNADEGDALWIEYGPDGGPAHRLLVDCGRKSAYRAVRNRLIALDAAGEPPAIELFILTHVDDDHIYGAVPLLGDAALDPTLVGDVWFNGWRHLSGEAEPPPDALGASKGEFFAALLHDRRFPWNEAFARFAVVVPDDGPLPSHTLPGGMKLTVLSPSLERVDAMREEWQKQLAEKQPGAPGYIAPGDTETALLALSDTKGMQPDALGKEWLDDWDPDRFHTYAGAMFTEDDRAPNGSTIAVLAEYDGKAVLLGGDAHPSVLVRSLERLAAERGSVLPIALDAFKVPHHGSENNVSDDLVAAVQCKRWLVSTNGSRHHHPHPAAIARIISGSLHPELYFNYRSAESEVWDSDQLRADPGYHATWGEEGLLTVAL